MSFIPRPAYAFITGIFLSVVLPILASAQEWTRFHGPNGTGESEATSIPAQWTEADYNWKVALPGVGHSSPVLWGKKIFLLSADPKTAVRYVLCLSADDGKELWRREFPSTPHPLHVRSSFGSSTPAVDAERVYVAWSDPEHTTLMALTHSGQDDWSLDLGSWISQHGFGTSPMLYEDLLVVQSSQEPDKRGGTPEHSFIVGVEKNSGQIRWRLPRKIDTASYSVPCVYRPKGGKAELLCCTTAEGVFSIDPKSGQENWSQPAFSMRTVSSPLVVDGLVFGTTGSGAGGNYVVAVKPGKSPDIVYEMKSQGQFKAPYVPTPVARGKLLFLWGDEGIVCCIDAADGHVHWTGRVGGTFSGSPVRVADKLYCIDDEGVVVVLAAGKEFKELGRNPLGEPSRSTPAVAGGRLYLRTYSHLISVGGKAL
jgi:outer membrane protein assembly factor BamB